MIAPPSSPRGESSVKPTSLEGRTASFVLDEVTRITAAIPEIKRTKRIAMTGSTECKRGRAGEATDREIILFMSIMIRERGWGDFMYIEILTLIPVIIAPLNLRSIFYPHLTRSTCRPAYQLEIRFDRTYRGVQAFFVYPRVIPRI